MRIVIACLLIIFSAVALPAFAKDRALVVGVDVYANRQVPATPGATDDAIAMQKLLIEELDFEPGSVKILLDSQATAREIVRNFETWLIDGTRPGDADPRCGKTRCLPGQTGTNFIAAATARRTRLFGAGPPRRRE